MSEPIRVMIVDDHPVVREGLSTLLGDETTFEIVGEAADGEAAVALALAKKPDVILMDVMLPGKNGVDAAKEIRARSAECQVVLLTSDIGQNLSMKEAIASGALGFLSKDVSKEELLRAIRNAHSGVPTMHAEAQRALMQESSAPPPPHTELTQRELGVLKQVAAGKSNKVIAGDLGLSEGTVKGYVSIILSKLGVSDRTQAAIYAIRHNLAMD